MLHNVIMLVSHRDKKRREDVIKEYLISFFKHSFKRDEKLFVSSRLFGDFNEMKNC